MNDVTHLAQPDRSPILLVPYMWIGDFVRCHSVVTLLRQRYPERPVDMLTSSLCLPLVDYMPGVRRGIVGDLPRNVLGLSDHKALADRLHEAGYGTALVMSRKWKAALAPFLARIPERIGFAGEFRFGLINDMRWGERRLPRMIDQCCALALPSGAARPAEWPLPELNVPRAEAQAWSAARGLGDMRPAVALAPGSVGPSKRWPAESYAELARSLTAQGFAVWVLGSPGESPLAAAIVQAGGNHARDLTSPDLRNAVMALKLARAAVSNDSGLLHVAAAIGTPSIGIFGPTNPWHWAPLNPLAATIETKTEVLCRPCHTPTCRMQHHRCMHDIPSSDVLVEVRRAVDAAAKPV